MRRWTAVPTALAVAVALAGTGVLLAAPASAQPVQTGSLTMTSEPGDYIGGGQTYQYSTSNRDAFTVFADQAGTTVQVSLQAGNADWFNLTFAAPADTPLAVGDYPAATRYPFQGPLVPGLDVSGNGRGCNELTGSFRVTESTIVEGYVQAFAVAFEQHCEGFEPALRGEVRITNPPPPPPLALGVTISASGTASTLTGRATVHGTLTCTQDARVTLTGKVTQVVRQRIVRGTFDVVVPCTAGIEAPWRGVADPDGATPFRAGDAYVETHSSAQDTVYNRLVSTDEAAVVRLRRTSDPQRRAAAA